MRTAVELAAAGVRVLDCEHRTPKAQSVGYPYIAIPDVVGGRVDLSTARRISEEDLLDWTRRNAPMAGDILVTRRGRVGDSAVIPEGLTCAIGQNLVLLRSDGVHVRQDYLRWAVRSPQWWREVERLRNVGAVFSSLNVRDIARIRIPLPTLAEQRAIAAVLGAIDDKIANNDRLTSAILDLADAEFAHLVRDVVPSPQSFADVAEISGGGTPNTKVPEYWGGDVNWATPTDITALRAPYLGETARRITSAGLKACASALHPKGSILMTSRATIGAFAIAQRPTAVNQGFIVVNARDPQLQCWLFHEMRSRVPEFLSQANGATFLELSRGNFKKMPVRLASPEVLARFAAEAASLHSRGHGAMLEVSILEALRDVLLPALISGSLKAKDVERVAGEVA